MQTKLIGEMILKNETLLFFNLNGRKKIIYEFIIYAKKRFIRAQSYSITKIIIFENVRKSKEKSRGYDICIFIVHGT